MWTQPFPRIFTHTKHTLAHLTDVHMNNTHTYVSVHVHTHTHMHTHSDTCTVVPPHTARRINSVRYKLA